MTKLLDFIFSNLTERHLDIEQIQAYNLYLDELMRSGLPVEVELEYQAIKRQLTIRLDNLQQEQINFTLRNKDGKEEDGTIANG